MKLKVDRDKCHRCLSCMDILTPLPKRKEKDHNNMELPCMPCMPEMAFDNGYKLGRIDKSKIEEAIDACPSGALSFEE